MKMIIRFFLACIILPKNIALYCLNIKTGYDTEENQASLLALRKEGAFLFPSQLAEGQVAELTDEYRRICEQSDVAQSGQDIGRIYNPHLKSPVVESYVDLYRKIAQQYFSDSAIDVELSMYQLSKPQQDLENVPGGYYHIDDNKKNLKFFIALTDIGEKSGPFTYMRRSHGVRSLARVWRWFMWEVTTKRQYLYFYDAKDSAQSVKMLTKKGGVFCADTTGLHKGTKVEEGERLVLVISFGEKRLDPYKLYYSLSGAA